MSAPYGCFEEVVGLSRTDCACYTTTMPLEATNSASDLYLDELPGLNLKKLFAASTCEADAWTIMRRGVEHGTRRFKEEVLRNVLANTAWKRSPVRNQIGDDSQSSRAVRLNKTYHGLSLMLADHVGGTATVKRIGTRMKFTGNITLNIYEADNDTPIRTETISAVANQTVWTTITDMELSMDAASSKNPWYWFLFEPTAGQEANNVRIHCGCAGKANWSRSTPWFESHVGVNGQMWTRWAMASGTYGDTLSEREDWSHNNATQGLLLDIDFKCDQMSAICDGVPDYEFDPLQAATAHAIRYGAAVYVLDMLAAGSAVDRDAILGDVAVGKLRQQYESAYNTRAEYVATVLSNPREPGNPKSGVNTYSDCFTCKMSGQPVIKTIRV
jgi:hypothetical protein